MKSNLYFKGLASSQIPADRENRLRFHGFLIDGLVFIHDLRFKINEMFKLIRPWKKVMFLTGQAKAKLFSLNFDFDWDWTVSNH